MPAELELRVTRDGMSAEVDPPFPTSTGFIVPAAGGTSGFT
jgi:hypothetical protein